MKVTSIAFWDEGKLIPAGTPAADLSPRILASVTQNEWFVDATESPTKPKATKPKATEPDAPAVEPPQAVEPDAPKPDAPAVEPPKAAPVKKPRTRGR